jgi:hypothetical protein
VFRPLFTAICWQPGAVCRAKQQVHCCSCAVFTITAISHTCITPWKATSDLTSHSTVLRTECIGTSRSGIAVGNPSHPSLLVLCRPA